MKVAVVTPTIGTDKLDKCIQSVQEQTYENLTHYIFLDGQEKFDAIYPTLYKNSGKRTIKTVALEENIGKGWYGHRVYAACPFLVNADIICYLDEDNWFEPGHVESLVKVLEDKSVHWAYSLRKIYDKDEKYLCDDNCESLGRWPAYVNDQVFHVDTSSYAVRREMIMPLTHAWYAQWGADRVFFGAMKKYLPNYKCTGLHSMCYRLDGNPNSVNEEFFKVGNDKMNDKFPNGFPWSN